MADRLFAAQAQMKAKLESDKDTNTKKTAGSQPATSSDANKKGDKKQVYTKPAGNPDNYGSCGEWQNRKKL